MEGMHTCGAAAWCVYGLRSVCAVLLGRLGKLHEHPPM